MPTKVCSGCKVEKPVSEFHRNKANKDGLQKHCKDCKSKRAKEYNQRPEVKGRCGLPQRKAYMQEYLKEYRHRPDVKDRLQEQARAYYVVRKNNPEYKERQRDNDWKYRQKPENKEKVRVHNLTAQGKASKRANAANQVARRYGCAGKLSQKDVLDLFQRYNRCLCCGIQGDIFTLTIDHVIPLSKGGPNTFDNLQSLCLSCNDSKADRAIDYR